MARIKQMGFKKLLDELAMLAYEAGVQDCKKKYAIETYYDEDVNKRRAGQVIARLETIARGAGIIR